MGNHGNFHTKYSVTPCVDTCGKMVIIEQYCNSGKQTELLERIIGNFRLQLHIILSCVTISLKKLCYVQYVHMLSA